MILYQPISSPLNYTGGKFKLLPQIFPLFPSQVDTFVDLFCGGGNVGINILSQQILFNDINQPLISLLKTFKSLDTSTIFEKINHIIDKYGLSKSSEKGYEYYGCTSDKGLASYNSKAFLKLRDTFNQCTQKDYNYYVMLYVLIVFAFNNQLRFNSKGFFNLPVGKRDFNKAIQLKLFKFINQLHKRECQFVSKDFRCIDFSNLTHNDFIYADPPYLITCASYNENGGWDYRKEIDLYTLLDEFHKRNIRFALSNVLSSKGKTNYLLQEWLEQHPHYKCHHLKSNYSNSNYQRKNKTSESDEVLIKNY